MAVPMRSTDFRSIVQPILNEDFDGVYDQRKDEYKALFEVKRGIPRNYHEDVVLNGMISAPELPDGDPVTYGKGGTFYTQRYVYKQYGLAYALTKVLVEDGDHISIGQTYARHLAQSIIETKEILTANVINLSFNSTVPGGDGVSLINTSHPNAYGGTWSNALGVPAALSQTSLEQLLIQIRNAVDDAGKRINLVPEHLVVPPSLEFQGTVIVKSALRSGSADNDINPIVSTGYLSKGVHVVTRLTSNTAFWIHTDAPRGLRVLTRRDVEKSMEGDFETDSMRYKATERYAVGFTNPRCLFGTPGQ